MKSSSYKILAFILVFSCAISSCRKFVTLDPPDDRLNYQSAYATNATATAVLNGLYIKIIETLNPITAYLSPYLGVSADELRNYNTVATNSFQILYTNAQTSAVDYFWNAFYNYISHCNAAIKGIENSKTLSAAVKSQLLGEARFMRSYCYFYLVNLYGKVPLLTSPDFEQYLQAKRSEESAVYQQIVDDLLQAQSTLSKSYLKSDALTAYPAGSEERVRPTYWAATALLARTYLYQKRWAEAEAASSIVLNNTSLFEPVPLASAFVRNSRESVFQLQNNVNQSQPNATTFVLVSSIGTFSNPVAISDSLRLAFESDDLRQTQWVGTKVISGITYSFPYKYKSNTFALATTNPEYLSLFRIGEQYLIRSEARAMQNNLTGAIDDLNVIRRRARGLPVTTPNSGADLSYSFSQSQVLDKVIKERQVELFTEQGHRWFDLKRTGRLNEVMQVITPLKGGIWQPYKQLFPVPASEINVDINLDQNPGYN